MKIEYLQELQPQAKISDSFKEKLVAEAMQEWQDWNEQIDEKRINSVDAREIYYQNKPKDLSYETAESYNDDTSSRVRFPALQQAVDSVVAQQHLASFPAEERFFRVQPLDKSSEKIKELYEKRVQEILNSLDFITNTLNDRKNLLLDGASAVWFPYIRKTKNKTSYNKPAVLGIDLELEDAPLEKSKRVKVIFEGTSFIPLNFCDWILDPLAENIEEGSFIHRRWTNKLELLSVDEFENKEDIKNYTESRTQYNIDNAGSYKLENQMNEGITNGVPEATQNHNVLLWNKFGDFYDEDTEKVYENYLLIWSNDNCFNYFGPNPYDHQMKPYAVNSYIPSAGTEYGKSIAQDIIPLCHELDTLINTLNDILHVTARPFYKYSIGDETLKAYFEQEGLNIRPGDMIPMDNINSLQPMQQDYSAVSVILTAMQRIKEEIRESTGGVPYATGGATQQDQQRTLGEVEILASGTNIRFQLAIQNYEHKKLKTWLEQSFENDKQLMSEPVDLGMDEELLTPELIKQSEFSFDVTGSRSVLSRNRDIAELDMFNQSYVPAIIKSGLGQFTEDRLVINGANLTLERCRMTSALKDTEQFITIKKPEEQPSVGLGGMPPQGMLQTPGQENTPPMLPPNMPIPQGQMPSGSSGGQ